MLVCGEGAGFGPGTGTGSGRVRVAVRLTGQNRNDPPHLAVGQVASRLGHRHVERCAAGSQFGRESEPNLQTQKINKNPPAVRFRLGSDGPVDLL